MKIEIDMPLETRVADAFTTIVKATASVTGLEFFRVLAREMSRTLGFRYALVSELTDVRMERARTLALWVGDRYGEDFGYELSGTPCEIVSRGEVCYYTRAITEMFPEDRVLIDMEAEAYIGIPLRDAKGHPIGILAALHDEPIFESDEVRSIFEVFASRAGVELERWRMQTLSEASERRFRGLLESGTDLILAVDRDGRIRYASPSCMRVAGYTPEEVEGRLAFDFLHASDRAMMLNMLCAAIGRPEPGPLFETKIQHKNGSWIDVESRANQLFFDPHTPGLVINCRDVSERKKAEAHLHFQKTLLETESECSLEGVLVMSHEGNVLHWNQRFAEIWKLEGDLALRGRAELYPAIIGQLADRERAEANVKRLWDNPEMTFHESTKLADGRTVECYTVPLRQKSGANFGRLWSCRDITEQVKLYEQVRDSQRLESIGMVSAGIAHEFKNILGPILGSAELAQMDIPPGHGAHRWLNQIIKSTQAARDLVQQILMFGRQAPTARTAVSLGDVVTDAVRMLRVAIPKSIDISRTVAPGLPQVVADSNQIHQVIMNLGINAWQAMDKGNGQISISLDLTNVTKVRANELQPGDYVRLTISDTGKGMDAETLTRLYEPFFTTKQPGQGTGLGMPVVHGIVTSHGGVINVESTPGVGTTFEIFFPIANESETENL